MKANEKVRKLLWGKSCLASSVKAAIAAACMVAALCANAAQYWRGTTANPVWDLTTANWASSASATTYSTYQNNTTGSQPYFDAGGATDVTVNADGVLAYVINVTGGNHTLSGGPITAQVLDPFGGALTIYNDVTLTTSDSGIYLGFRPRSGGTITVGAGGTLAAHIVPFSDGTLDTKLVVLTNGTLKARFQKDQIKNNKFTLYFNGGTFIPLINEDKEFVNSRFLLGPGGLHLQERAAAENCWSHLPGPIGTDTNFDTDGGIRIDEHLGYMLLPNFTCTYRGGVYINSSSGYLGVRAEGNLGAVPEMPTNNIFFLKSGATLIGHGGGGNIRLHPNRNLYLADGVKAKLETWSGSAQSITIQGTIGCENVTNGVVETLSYSGQNDEGVVAFCPPDNRTNQIGRLFVKCPTVIGRGTTVLKNTTKLSWGREGSNDENWAVNDGSQLNITSNALLMVTGGLLRAGTRTSCNNARMTISGSGVVDVSGAEFMHAYSAAAATTIRDGGKFIVSSLRMAGDSPSVYGDPAKSVVNVETGGTLRVSNSLYCTATNRYATLNFNGGTLEWARNVDLATLEASYPAATRTALTFKISEGGMIVTNVNSITFRIGIPIQSGAEHDGGVTVYGSGSTFSLEGACTFNGPLTVMQGTYRLGANNALNSNITVRVNSGANFIMNTRNQSVARIEGSGTFKSVEPNPYEKLSITEAIAPGMGTNSLGTLTVKNDICDIADDVALEIDVDTAGNGDCLSYPAEIDLSKMTLQVNDTTKLNRSHRYKIATLPGGIKDNALFKSTNLPVGWEARYYASSHELWLVPVKGAKIVVR